MVYSEENMSGSDDGMDMGINYSDGQQVLDALADVDSDRELLLQSLFDQLKTEETLPFMPLLTSLLNISNTLTPVLDIWATHASSKKIGNLDRLFISTFTLVIKNLTSRADLIEKEFKVASPAIVVKGLIAKMGEAIQGFLNSGMAWIHKLVYELLEAIHQVGPQLIQLSLVSFQLKPQVLGKVLGLPSAPREGFLPEGTDVNMYRVSQRYEIRNSFLSLCKSYFQNLDGPSLTQVINLNLFSRLVKGLSSDSYLFVKDFFEAVGRWVLGNRAVNKAQMVAQFDRAFLDKCLDLLLLSDEVDGLPSGQTISSLTYTFLLELCTKPGQGICFVTDGWYLPVIKGDTAQSQVYNRLLLDTMYSMQPTDHPIHQKLLLEVMRSCPELVAHFWSGASLSLDPRLSTKWLSNISLYQKLIQLDVPLLEGDAIDPPPVNVVVDNIMPDAFNRAYQAKGLQHSSALVRYFTCLTLMACFDKLTLVMSKFADHSTRLPATAAQKWTEFNELVRLEIRRRIVDFQVVLQLHQLSPDTKEGSDSKAWLSKQVVVKLILMVQANYPDLIIQSNFDFGKLLPNELDKDHALSQAHTLALLMQLPDLKWWSDSQASQSSHIIKLIHLYLTTPHMSLKARCHEVIHKLLKESPIFHHDPNELIVWLNSVQSLACGMDSKELGDLLDGLDRAITLMMRSPYKFIDSVHHLHSTYKSSSTYQSDLSSMPWLGDDEGKDLMVSPLFLVLGTMVTDKPDIGDVYLRLIGRLGMDLLIYTNHLGPLLFYVEQLADKLGSNLVLDGKYMRNRLSMIAVQEVSTGKSMDIIELPELNQLSSFLSTLSIASLVDSLVPILTHYGPLCHSYLVTFLNQKYVSTPFITLSTLSFWHQSPSDITLLRQFLICIPLNVLLTISSGDALSDPLYQVVLSELSTKDSYSSVMVARSVILNLLGQTDGSKHAISNTFFLLHHILGHSLKLNATDPIQFAIFDHPILKWLFLTVQTDWLDNLLVWYHSSVEKECLAWYGSVLYEQYSSMITNLNSAPHQHNDGLVKILTKTHSMELFTKLMSLKPSQLVQSPPLFRLLRSLVQIISNSDKIAQYLPYLITIWTSTKDLGYKKVFMELLDGLLPYHEVLSNKIGNSVGKDHSNLVRRVEIRLARPVPLEPLTQIMEQLIQLNHFGPIDLNLLKVLVPNNKVLGSKFVNFLMKLGMDKLVHLVNIDLEGWFKLLLIVGKTLGEFINNDKKKKEIRWFNNADSIDRKVAEMISKIVVPIIIQKIADLSDEIDKDLLAEILRFYLPLYPINLAADLIKQIKDNTPSYVIAELCKVFSEQDGVRELVNNLNLTTNIDVKFIDDTGVIVDWVIDHYNEELVDNMKEKLVELMSLNVGQNEVSKLATCWANLSALCKGNENQDIKLIDLINKVLEKCTDSLLLKESISELVDVLYQIYLHKPDLIVNPVNVTRLGSLYNARASIADRKLLAMLVGYEAKGEKSVRSVGLLFGSHGARFTEWELKRLVMTGDIVDLSLGLIQPGVMFRTVQNFPTDFIMSKWLDHPIQSSLSSQGEDIYDPYFLLNLMGNWLSFGNKLDLLKLVRCNGLGFLAVCLSSDDGLTRKVAYKLMDELYALMEHASFPDLPQLQTLLSSLRNSVSTQIRLPGPVTQFVALASLIVINPTHPLYLTINHYLLAKPNFTLLDIPTFAFFFSTFTANSYRERSWIVQVCCKGLIHGSDFKLFKRCLAPGMLMSYYFNPPPAAANKNKRNKKKEENDDKARSISRHELPILEMIFRSAKLPRIAAKFLVDHAALSFLSSAINNALDNKNFKLALVISRVTYHLVFNADRCALSTSMPNWSDSLLSLALSALNNLTQLKKESGLALIHSILKLVLQTVLYNLANGKKDHHLSPRLNSIVTQTINLIQSILPLTNNQIHQNITPIETIYNTNNNANLSFDVLNQIPTTDNDLNLMYKDILDILVKLSAQSNHLDRKLLRNLSARSILKGKVSWVMDN